MAILRIQIRGIGMVALGVVIAAFGSGCLVQDRGTSGGRREVTKADVERWKREFTNWGRCGPNEARFQNVPYLEPGTAIYVEDLEAWEDETGVTVSPGDAVFIRTGRWARRAAVGPWDIASEAHWATELRRTDLRFGQFGENFTVEGMPDDEIHVGDRFRIGTAVFKVTQPRVPCYKLGIKMQTDGFYNMLL